MNKQKKTISTLGISKAHSQVRGEADALPSLLFIRPECGMVDSLTFFYQSIFQRASLPTIAFGPIPCEESINPPS